MKEKDINVDVHKKKKKINKYAKLFCFLYSDVLQLVSIS